jgi:DHA1 family bicyclomycin/chloramphenicol resistance-like MFS transporter
MTTPAQPERALPAWALIVLLGAFASLTSMSVGMYLPALPRIAVDLQAPAHAVTATLSLFLVGRVLLTLGAAAVMVTGRAVVRDLYQEHDAARFLAATTLITGLMPIIAPLAGTAVLAAPAGARSSWSRRSPPYRC